MDLLNVEDNTLSHEDLDAVIKTIASGESANWDGLLLKPDNHFYILGLAPNAARLSVRFFLQDTLGSVVKHTSGPDKGKAFADNEPLMMEADVTIRYYYRYELIDTADGRVLVKNRMNLILTALKGAGFSCSGGFFDAGDVDEVGCFTSVRNVRLGGLCSG